MNDTRTERAYYLRHTSNTDPGRYGYLFDSLGDDIDVLFQAARHVVEHHGGLNAARIGPHRLAEMDVYRVEDLLGKVAAHGVRDLREDVPLEHKTIGNCVNISKVACGMLRHKGIPARIRYAYCTYFYPRLAHEQTLVEYWLDEQGRWLRGDASMNWPVLRARKIDVEIDFRDVAEHLSKPVAKVWQACRRGEDRFDRYGNYNRVGMGHVAQKMLHDLACLNQVEMMPWDFGAPATFFWTSRPLDSLAFDALAEQMAGASWDELLYTARRLPFFAVPRRVLRKSPYSGNSLTFVKEGVWKTP